MSDAPGIVGAHRATRVRSLGDAVPLPLPRVRDGDTVTAAPKSADTLRAEADERRDSQPMTASCGIDGCDWTHTATAGECRGEAAEHRASRHPELKQGHRRGGYRFKRRGEIVDPARVAESRRIRQEKDDAGRLATITAGRAARGELLEEAASATDGDVGAASSSRNTIHQEDVVKRCKTPGCDGDAFDAPAMGPYAGKCPLHREAMRQRKAAQASTQNRLHGGTPTTRPGRVRREAPPVTPEPAPVAEPSLATLAHELEAARTDLEAATARYAAAVAAFKQHDVVQRIASEDGVAA